MSEERRLMRQRLEAWLGYAVDSGSHPAAETLAATLATGATLDDLIDAATVNHTAFFRHLEQFAELERRLRELKEAGWSRVRFWSAGCATGEEPYSIALLCDHIGFDFEILATDVSARAIATAERGRYAPPAVAAVAGYGGPADGVMPARLRNRIHFEVASLANLERSNAELGFDFIFCRNVLIYFDRPAAFVVLERLAERLAPAGHVVVAPVEGLIPRPPTLCPTDELAWLCRAPPRSEVVPTSIFLPVLEPANPSPLRRAARALSSGAPHQAEILLRHELETQPDDAGIWYSLGEALEARHEMTQARVAFERAGACAAAREDSPEMLSLMRSARGRADRLKP